MRILVTGSSGFIGRAVVRELRLRRHEVDAPGLMSPRLDMLDYAAVDSHLKAHPADGLVHAAWLKGDDRATSIDNLGWVAASAHLLESFIRFGGQRVVTLGTCFEYEFATPTLDASVTPVDPHTIYGATKAAVGSLVSSMEKLGIVSGAHARIGYVYGPGELPPRLVPALVEALASGMLYKTSDGLQKRDYLHVSDVATALATLFESDVRGPINIGHGTAIAVRELVEEVASVVGRPDLVEFGTLPRRSGDPEEITLSIGPLLALGWQARFSLQEGVADTVHSLLANKSVNA